MWNLNLVKVGDPVRTEQLDALRRHIRSAFLGLVDSVTQVDLDAPGVEEIEAELLSQALDQQVGGHILGVTDVDLVDASGGDLFRFMFGCKDNRNHVALVSTRRIATADPGRSLARLIKVALHELGHNFGLVHHYSFAKAEDGAYCPMSKGDYNRHGERSYKRAVIDGRGFRFCDRCQEFLRFARAVAESSDNPS